MFMLLSGGFSAEKIQKVKQRYEFFKKIQENFIRDEAECFYTCRVCAAVLCLHVLYEGAASAKRA